MATTTFGAKILKEDQRWYLEHLAEQLRRLHEAACRGDWCQLEDLLPHIARGGRCYGFPGISELGEQAVKACAAQDSSALKAALNELSSIISVD